MATVINPRQYIIGAAEIYYRAIGVLTPWTSLGATLDDTVARIMTTWFRPDNIAGVMGPVQGLDVLTKVDAEFEFTLPEIAGDKLALAIPGSRTTTGLGTAAGGTPFSSTLSAATAAGVTTIPVVATTNLAVGDPIKIGTGSTAEWRVVTAISALNVSFRDVLIFAHASGEAAIETVDDNRTLIQAPIIRRQPDSAYREWAIVAQAGMGNNYELRIPRGIAQSESAELTFGDETLSGVRVTIGARYDGAALETSPFNLYAPVS